MLTLGNTDIADIRLGEANVAAVYRGENLVWTKNKMPVNISLTTDGTDVFIAMNGELPDGYEICKLERGAHGNTSPRGASFPRRRYTQRSKYRWRVSRDFYKVEANTGRLYHPKTTGGYRAIDDWDSTTSETKGLPVVYLSERRRFRFYDGLDAIYKSIGVAVYERRKGGKGNGKRISNVCFFNIRITYDYENYTLDATLTV